MSYMPKTKQKPDEKKLASVTLVEFGQKQSEENNESGDFDSELPF